MQRRRGWQRCSCGCRSNMLCLLPPALSCCPACPYVNYPTPSPLPTLPPGVASLHPAVADRLPSVLLAAAAALAAVGKREQLQTVVAFASAVPNRISQAVYQQLNQLQASVA